jgi:hypothetical protein
MPDSDYGTVEQAQQVFLGNAAVFESMWTNRGKELSDFDLAAASKREKESPK